MSSFTVGTSHFFSTNQLLLEVKVSNQIMRANYCQRGVLLSMNKILIFLFALLAVESCCRPTSLWVIDCETVCVGTIRSDDKFIDLIDSVEFIILKDEGDHLLGNMIEVSCISDAYIVTDIKNASVFRFSDIGEYVCRIGEKGNASNEFINILNAQCTDSVVNVFSSPNLITTYSSFGEFICRNKEEDLGYYSLCLNDGILSFIGYSYGCGPRLKYLYYNSEKCISFMESERSHLSLQDGRQVLNYLPDGSVSVIDSYYPVVYKFDEIEKCCSPYVKFDLGKYNIDERFYELSDPFAGGDLLLSSSFGLLHKYLEDENGNRLVQIILNLDGGGEAIYGFLGSKDWIWFSLPETSPSDGPIMFKDGALYWQVDMSTNISFPLPDINKNDNDYGYGIAKIHFKEDVCLGHAGSGACAINQ